PAMVEASGATHLLLRDPGQLPGVADVLAGASLVTSVGPASLYRLAPVLRTPDQVAAPEGEVALELPLDPDHASTGWIDVALACGQQGAMASLAWELDRPGPGRGPLRRWTMADCGNEGVARARMYFAALPGAGALRVVA